MLVAPQMAEVAQMVSDPGRANILSTLMDGRALTAGELARVAGVTPQTASSHLSKLVERRLLVMDKRGPRRFYRLATAEIAQMLEGMMVVAVAGPPRFRPPSRIDAEMRRARTCYDHLAGRLGVALADGLVRRRVLRHQDGELTLVRRGSGEALLNDWGIDVPALESARRPMVRTCIDWTERRLHLAGALGAAIVDRFLESGWIRRRRDDRAVSVTPLGQRRLKEELGVSV